jgi:hypothetical protein
MNALTKAFAEGVLAMLGRPHDERSRGIKALPMNQNRFTGIKSCPDRLFANKIHKKNLTKNR